VRAGQAAGPDTSGRLLPLRHGLSGVEPRAEVRSSTGERVRRQE
jgi:hypothetical protein